MALKKWDPFVDAETFREELDRLFEAVLRKPWAGAEGAWAAPWTLHADVYVEDGVVHVDVDLPGVDPGQTEVEARDSVLTVRGRRTCRREETRAGVWRVERRSGSFSRAIPLPAPVDPASLEVEFEGGVLHATAKLARPEPAPKA